MKHLLSALTILLLLFIAPVTHASGFYLSAIGALDVSDTAYNHYWYKGASPALRGVAPAGATVTVTIDSVSATTTADASGNWAYQTNIGEGDHSISLATATAATYTFTLTIGELPEGVGGIESTASTPVAGVATPTFLLLGIGLGLLVTPFIVKKYAFLS